MDGVAADGSQGMATALVVDDLEEVREVIGGRLAEVGFSVAYAKDGLDAFTVFVRDAPDLVVTDQQMPRLNGIGLVRRIRQISDVPVVMIAAFGSVPECEEAMRVGVDRYLEFGRDLNRVGEVARELILDSAVTEGDVAPEPSSSASAISPMGMRTAIGGMTAAEARSLAQQELRAELQKQLFDCRGNIAEMARRMGRDRSTIRYHLRRLGMLDLKAGVSTPKHRSGGSRRIAD